MVQPQRQPRSPDGDVERAGGSAPDDPAALGRNVGVELVARWPAFRPFAVVGTACVVAGGLVAALTRPTGFEAGPWVAAFLVLVGGVAQLLLGAGHVYLSEPVPSRSSALLALVVWNASVVATVAGTLASAPILTTAGGLGTVAAVVLFGRGRSRRPALGDTWFRGAYLAVLVVLLVSAPVGVALSWLRHG